MPDITPEEQWSIGARKALEAAKHLLESGDYISFHPSFMSPINRKSGIQIARRLKKIWQKDFPTSVQQVYLFGSVARDQAHTDSDIDIAVVCAPFARSKIREARAFYASSPDMDARVSLVVVHPQELNQKTMVLPATLLSEGIVI